MAQKQKVPYEIEKEAIEVLGTKPKSSKLSSRERYYVDKFLETGKPQYSDGRYWHSVDDLKVKENYKGVPLLYKENYHGGNERYYAVVGDKKYLFNVD